MTSRNGAQRAVGRGAGRGPACGRWSDRAPRPRWRRRRRAALVPDRFVAEGLLEVFPRRPSTARPRAAGPGRGRPAGAGRGVAAAGLGGDRGRRLPDGPGHTGRGGRGGGRADAIAFTSGSTVDGFVARWRAGVPGPSSWPVVVAIGPVTAAAAARHGLAVAGWLIPTRWRASSRRRWRRWHEPVTAPASGDGVRPRRHDRGHRIGRVRGHPRVWPQHGLDFPLERWSQVVGLAWSPGWAAELRTGRRRPGRGRAARRQATTTPSWSMGSMSGPGWPS